MRRRRMRVVALAVMAVLGLSGAQADQPNRISVVELFTSQACSACPPADALLGELAQREDLLALSLSIDYWNYLDWKDTLADPAFTKRQRAYAKSRGDRKVYTPQAVVNGQFQVVGSDVAAMEAALADAARDEEEPVPLSVVAVDDKALRIDAGAAADRVRVRPATLWLVVYTDRRTVRIKAGENEGRSITYHNVVRKLEPLGSWQGAPVRLTVDLPKLEDGQRCAVLLQEGSPQNPGRILSAARL